MQNEKIGFSSMFSKFAEIDEYAVHKFTNRKFIVTFCFSQLTGDITVSGNCRVRIYKSYMHEHFGFCSQQNYGKSVVYQLTDLVYTIAQENVAKFIIRK